MAVVAGMCSLIFFGLGAAYGTSIGSQDFKELVVPVLDMLGGWVSGLGTLAAVMVSLWLTGKQGRENAEDIEVKQLAMQDYLKIDLISKGNRTAVITGLELFETGSGKRLTIDKYMKMPSLPAKLEYGGQVTFLLLDEHKTAIRNETHKWFVNKFSSMSLKVTTTISVYVVPLNKIYADSLKRSYEFEQKSKAFHEEHLRQLLEDQE
jgi:hypothetical protein